ncbi:class I adenylate-forming enzyme family protein [Actinacidiphila oryziradicis]|uniref:Acyl--CoA ligase n=1 Tax=Actinacidiphila oryziradicis TaxID=2571141 RepID=A0A4U0RXD3_9ACTN|nr:class I adenylate-forming enzyme family protein [Actinacidiphila oryziradicis]TKA00298.1 acyl--CoA ligase [Actinacidiphila oryziradicis]
MRELLKCHEDLASRRPEDPAVIYRCEPHAGLVLTWADLCERAEQIRATLLAGGARSHCVSALVLNDHPDLIPTLLALWQLDSPPVLLDPQWGGRLTASILAHSTPVFRVDLVPSVTVTPLNRDTPSDVPADAVFIGYTSGSTGDPKAIVFTHERLYDGTLGNVSASLRLRGTRPSRLARSMRMSGSGVINLHHTWGAVLGACVVVLPELTVETARGYWSRLEENRIDQTFLVPQLVELVNRFSQDRDATVPGPLCFTGSAPLSPRTQERFQRRFGLPLFNAYGLSETSSAAFFGHLGDDGLATIRIGVPERVAARLRDAAGRIVEGPGEGEIELAGDQVFGGYYRNSAATAETLVDGWLRTGDIARRDGAGIHQLVGRSKDAVMKGSYAIYLTEVEEAAAAHPDVLEAAAVPLRLADSTEDIGCLVRLVDGSTAAADAILGWLRDALGARRAPCRVVLTAEPLPRGGQDKLVRPAVMARWDDLPNVPRTLRGSWETSGAGR